MGQVVEIRKDNGGETRGTGQERGKSRNPRKGETRREGGRGKAGPVRGCQNWPRRVDSCILHKQVGVCVSRPLGVQVTPL